MSEDYTMDERLEDVIVGYAGDYLRADRQVQWPDVVEALARHDAEVKAAALRGIDRDGLARAWFEAGAQSAARQFGLNEPVQWKNLTQADVDCLLEQADTVIAWLTGGAS